jgi:hypothetical protein
MTGSVGLPLCGGGGAKPSRLATAVPVTRFTTLAMPATCPAVVTAWRLN